ncbi:hypothetical protein E2C01_067490 [Portunus trituberculatus]|uniref:Uncharacterized protein n=1 Tax=Portunus trituberculatus TaxID=210409 RepID=A0A5B7HPG5_PORTR|nr:hypothetical protein [Portunus trituberculatus]
MPSKLPSQRFRQARFHSLLP